MSGVECAHVNVVAEHPELGWMCADCLAANGAKATPTSNGRYEGRVLNVRAILTEPDEPIPWRCEGIAADGYLTVLAGRGGEGKSWLALALACGVADGRSAAGIDCAEGKAVIFDAENGRKLIARRFRAATVAADSSIQPVESGGLRVQDDLDWFKSVISDQGANLAVFDSLRVLSSGAKENDADEMEPLITALKLLARDTGAAIILIHHRGRAEGSEFRGSSVILDQTDMLFTLGRVQGDPDGRHRRKIATIKCRIDEEPEPRWVAIEADSSRGLVYVNEAEPFEPDESSRPRDSLREDVLELLGGIARSGRSIAKVLDKSEATVRRVLHDLEGDGLAELRAEGWVRHAPPPKGVDAPDAPLETRSLEPKEGASATLTPLAPDAPRCSCFDGRQGERDDGRCSRCWGVAA
jgi:AAA domain